MPAPSFPSSAFLHTPFVWTCSKKARECEKKGVTAALPPRPRGPRTGGGSCLGRAWRRPPLAHALWDQRLLETDAEALRYRMAASRLRLRRGQVDTLRQRVQACLDAELRALEALEAEALRQHLQQLHALKYGQYLSVLSAHLEAASGGSIGMVKLMPDSEEVRQVLVEVGVPAGAPLQVLHAYRLRNTRLQTDFGHAALESAAPGGAASSSGGGGGGGSDGGADAHEQQRRRRPARSGCSLRLPTSRWAQARARPAAHPADDDDALVAGRPAHGARGGCVDMKSLAASSCSAPPPRRSRSSRGRRRGRRSSPGRWRRRSPRATPRRRNSSPAAESQRGAAAAAAGRRRSNRGWCGPAEQAAIAAAGGAAAQPTAAMGGAAAAASAGPDWRRANE